MLFYTAIKGSALDNLDRGVVIAAIAGMAVNIFEQALFGFLLTFLATFVYSVIRNRVQNLDQFVDDELSDQSLSNIPSLQIYATLCQWLASKELYYGLLDDLFENSDSLNNQQINRRLRNSFVQVVLYRAWLKLLTLFGLDRLIN